MSFGGYWGKILRVNLTTEEISVQEFDEAFDLAIKGCHEVAKMQKEAILKKFEKEGQ